VEARFFSRSFKTMRPNSEGSTSIPLLDDGSFAARVSFLEIGEEDRTQLRELREILVPQLDSLIGDWHGYLLERHETHDLLSQSRVQEHLKVVQAKYFRSLLAGPYDRAYFEERLRIGLVHECVGLEPPWYTGSYRKFQDLVRSLLLGRDFDPLRISRWIASLEKIIYLDMQLALDAYFHARNREIVRANEALRRVTRQLEQRNRELTHQFERAQEAARIKDEFLSKVSHELRTPLNAVVGFADLMADGIEGPVTESQAQDLRKIHAHGKRLLEMVDQMIDAAKLAAAAISEPRPFDPAPVLGQLSVNARAAARSKGLELRWRVPADLPPVIGDPEGFALALGHLLDNAVRFTIAGEVSIEAARARERVRFSVIDTGPGVPEEHRERIFEAFHQVESGDTRTCVGLGMGLTLARQALSRMGGTLELATTGPRGSSFVVELPAAVLETEATDR
jgi:signal transduction histidine kinase